MKLKKKHGKKYRHRILKMQNLFSNLLTVNYQGSMCVSFTHSLAHIHTLRIRILVGILSCIFFGLKENV